MTVSGNISGIKKEIITLLEELNEKTYPRDLLVAPELAQELASLTQAVNKEIAVYLDRHGQVRQIMVGDHKTVPLVKEHLRRDPGHLAGIRCLHTHPNGDSTLSGLDLTSMNEYKLDAMAAIGVWDGNISGIRVAFPQLDQTAPEKYSIYGPFSLEQIVKFPFLDILRRLEKEISKPTGYEMEQRGERALLIGFQQPRKASLSPEGSITELEELAVTAGAEVVGKILLGQEKPDPHQFLGKGKVQELAGYRQRESLDLVIFDDELSPRQQNNLEEGIGCRVLDRTALILQIFADRARTKEGILQVELAQLNYLLPRLTGYGTSMSRLGGGIGTRGPGESKLEADRRKIRKRITGLQEEIEEVKKQRTVLRQRRVQNNLPVVALVGYTNAGKSTLMNTLTQANVLAENKLFATLDTTTRKLKLKQGEVLLSDTVGFIHKLPHTLIAAFRATLEEINYADLLLHVVDAGSPYYQAQISAVQEVLEELEIVPKPVILLFNKWDAVTDPIEVLSYVKQHSPALTISAHTGQNIPELLEAIRENLPDPPRKVVLLIPYPEASLLNVLYDHGEVLATEYLGEGILCTAHIRASWADKMHKYFYSRAD